MIKKWNNFILESVSEKELSDLKYKAENFIGESEMTELLNDQVLYNIVSDVLKYAEWRYDDIAKEIANWYIGLFGKFEGWVGSEWRREISKKKYGDKALFISKVVDFYNKIKDEFEISEGGYKYPKISDLSKDMETICISSLDKIEFWEVYETYSNVIVRCGIDKTDNMNVYFLDDLSEELIPMCKRIEQELNLKNDHMSFEQEESKDYFGIVLGFVRVS